METRSMRPRRSLRHARQIRRQRDATRNARPGILCSCDRPLSCGFSDLYMLTPRPALSKHRRDQRESAMTFEEMQADFVRSRPRVPSLPITGVIVYSMIAMLSIVVAPEHRNLTLFLGF